MSDDTNDVTTKSSYGWLFSTITAFGLLLFLAMSFAFYHRRLLLKRRKEAEYNRFFRFLRPDLDVTDKKITRARSILTNTHNTDLAFIDSEAYYNEAFERDDGDDDDVNEELDDNDIESNLATARYDTRQIDGMEVKQTEDQDLYMRSVKARRQVLLADVHSEEIFRESDINEVFKTIDLIGNDNGKEVNTEDVRRVGTNEKVKELDFKNIGMVQVGHSLSHVPSRDTSVIPKISSHQLLSCKPPLLKPISKSEIKNEKLVKKSTIKSNKTKKKKRGILGRASERNKVALNEGGSKKSSFYSEPRRGSEPALFLDDEEAADPRDSNLYKNQNKILYNPYYTEVSMPVNKDQKRRSSSAEDMIEVNHFQRQTLNRERSMPVTDEIYEKHVPTSTWM